VALFGLRRIGKTLLLKEFMAREKARPDRHFLIELAFGLPARLAQERGIRFLLILAELERQAVVHRQDRLHFVGSGICPRQRHPGEHGARATASGRTAGSTFRQIGP
jgi:hypothetical protein